MARCARCFSLHHLKHTVKNNSCSAKKEGQLDVFSWRPYSSFPFGHLRPYTSIYDHLQQFTTIYDHLRPLGSLIYDHLRPFTFIYVHIRSFTSISVGHWRIWQFTRVIQRMAFIGNMYWLWQCLPPPHPPLWRRPSAASTTEGGRLRRPPSVVDSIMVDGEAANIAIANTYSQWRPFFESLEWIAKSVNGRR